MNEKSTLSIDIISSCICRDCFEIGNRTLMHHNYKIEFFHQAASPLSMYSMPDDRVQGITEENLVFGTPWMRRLVVTDLRKNLFEKIGPDKREDFLLLDFTDFARELIVLDPEAPAYLLKTNMMQNNSALFNEYVKGTLPPSGVSKEFLDNCIDRFAEDILRLYDSSKVILFTAHYVDKYLSKDGEIKPFPSTKRVNDFIDYCYSRFIEYFNCRNEKIHIIEPPKNALCNELHKWGNSNRHFCAEYYEYLLSAIDCCTSLYEEEIEKEMLSELLKRCEREFNRISSLANSKKELAKQIALAQEAIKTTNENQEKNSSHTGKKGFLSFLFKSKK